MKITLIATCIIIGFYLGITFMSLLFISRERELDNDRLYSKRNRD